MQKKTENCDKRLMCLVDTLDAMGPFAQKEDYIDLLMQARPEDASRTEIVYMAGFVTGRFFKEMDEFQIFMDAIKSSFDPGELLHLSLDDFEARLRSTDDDFARGFYDARFLYERLGFNAGIILVQQRSKFKESGPLIPQEEKEARKSV